jgi:dTDP-4-amino-4,6-dideoxygalactose transaminase
MRFFQLAPSGTPITIGELLKWLLRQPRASRVLEEFKLTFCQHYRHGHCFFVSSGRAAMVLLLRAFKSLAPPQRNVVIVPSYTCYSVPTAAIRAGLRVRVVDVDPQTLSYNLEQLSNTDFSNVLAIISANLYGLPNDLAAIAALARQHGVFLLDDAAQSLGATFHGQHVGSFGDAGLYSLDKGKNITSIQGGILLTHSPDIAAALQREMASLPAPPWQRTLTQGIQLIIYSLLLRPWLYWMPARLPFLKLGVTRYEIDYPIERYNPRLGMMAALLFRRMDAITRQRVANARRYLAQLRDIPFIHLPPALPGAEPAWLRLPVLADSGTRRDRLLARLNAEGFGATGSYPRSTLDIPEIQDHLDPLSHGEAGRSIAERILTLPTHSYVRSNHIDRICSIVEAGQ